jgi:hypothetical protein
MAAPDLLHGLLLFGSVLGRPAVLAPEFRRESVTEIEKRVGPTVVRRFRAGHLRVGHVKVADLFQRHYGFRLRCGLDCRILGLQGQLASVVGVLNGLRGSVPVLDALAVRIAQRDATGAFQGIPVASFAEVMAFVLAPPFPADFLGLFWP